jgi:hypothetical protein
MLFQRVIDWFHNRHIRTVHADRIPTRIPVLSFMSLTAGCLWCDSNSSFASMIFRLLLVSVKDCRNQSTSCYAITRMLAKSRLTTGWDTVCASCWKASAECPKRGLEDALKPRARDSQRQVPPDQSIRLQLWIPFLSFFSAPYVESLSLYLSCLSFSPQGNLYLSFLLVRVCKKYC